MNVKRYLYYKRVIQCILSGHKWAVRYKKDGLGEKRRAVICDRCGKELMVKRLASA